MIVDTNKMSGYDWEKLVLSTLKGQENEVNTDERYNPTQYTFYSIVNTGVGMDQGACAVAVTYFIFIIL